MPRIARAVAKGYPHHIIQRGNNRDVVFFDDDDKRRYLELLRKYAGKWDGVLLAYCLMSNHVHLLVKPLKGKSLYKMMQGLTLCYSQYANRKYGNNKKRSGEKCRGQPLTLDSTKEGSQFLFHLTIVSSFANMHT